MYFFSVLIFRRAYSTPLHQVKLNMASILKSHIYFYIFTWFDSRLLECVYSFAICDCYCCCFFFSSFYYPVIPFTFRLFSVVLRTGLGFMSISVIARIKWRINNYPFSSQLYNKLKTVYNLCLWAAQWEENKNWNKQNDKINKKKLNCTDNPCVSTKLFLVLFIYDKYKFDDKCNYQQFMRPNTWRNKQQKYHYP